MSCAPDIQVRRFENIDAIGEHARAIDALNLASVRPSPFATFAHLANAIRHGPFAAQCARARIWFLGAFEGDSLIGYAALKWTCERMLGMPARRIGFLFGHDFDRPGVVARRDHLDGVARGLCRYLGTHRREWDYVEFEQQDESSPLRPLPADNLLAGCTVREFPNWDNCTIAIRWETIGDYFAALNRKFATNVRRQMRKLYSLGTLEVIASSDPQSTPALLEAFCDIERRSWKTGFENSVGADPARLAYYRGLLDPGQPM
jgi:Acetyltransferase (GNAT) domain